MKFTAAPLQGAFIIEPEPSEDFRGAFARLWCQKTFAKQGLNSNLSQISVSSTKQAGTIRGMHFQWPPSRECKLVRCQRGRVFDVIVDLRPQSATFTRHFAIELNAQQHTALYIPEGFAHGFQSLVDNSEIHYMMSDDYQPDLYGGVRYDDPAFAIDWPLSVSCIHPRDKAYSDFIATKFTEQLLTRQQKEST